MSEPRKQSKRWIEIQKIWEQFAGFYDLFRGSVLVTILLVIGAYLFATEILDDYTTNVFTELIGVIGTALILDRLYRRRAEIERKEELIFQLGSEEPLAAKQAARMLRHKGWLTDGSIDNANLRHANLQSTNLRDACLRSVDLARASLQQITLSNSDLRNATLIGSNLFHAELIEANLSGAVLIAVNLKNANLNLANLCQADLWEANLDNADLSLANLQNARLVSAKLENTKFEFTVLPDGTLWTPETDMTRFTDPNHSEFWSSEPK